MVVELFYYFSCVCSMVRLATQVPVEGVKAEKSVWGLLCHWLYVGAFREAVGRAVKGLDWTHTAELF
jgi:hypothetical protein